MRCSTFCTAAITGGGIKTPHPILVTGATGAIGPRVVHALHDLGYTTRVLVRHAPPPGLLPDGVDVRRGDITDRSKVELAMTGVEAVIHMAALLHVVNPLPALREEYERVNVDGTAVVVEAARRAGTRRVVFFSSIAVYGPGKGQVLSEETPPCPDSFYGETKRAAEEIVLGTKGRAGQSLGTVLRLGAVYGARLKGNYRRLVEALARGRFLPIGHGENRRTLVYDRDAARAALLAMQHAAAGGRIYNVSDGQVHRLRDIIIAICESLGRRPPRFSLPPGPVRFAAGLLEDAASLIGRQFPIGRSSIDKYTEDVPVDGRRIQAELGFVPQFDMATGWRETILEMRQAGQL